MKILIDTCGLDLGYKEILKAVSMLNDKEIQISVIGNENIKNDFKNNNIDFIIANEEISTSEKNPAFAIRKYKDSTLVKGLTLLKNDSFDAFISAGSTGALLAGAMLVVGRIPNVKRACLMLPLPNIKYNKKTFLLDVGANVDIGPEVLLSFAEMACEYVKNTTKNSSLSIKLLNNGIEEEKGTELTKETHKLLKQSSLNFTGNIEARYIFETDADIIVTDGFTGNVLLKSVEGTVNLFKSTLKDLANSSLKNKLGLGLIYTDLKKQLSSLDSSKVGALPLLGVGKLVMKAHGSSNAEAIYNSIMASKDLVDSHFIKKLIEIYNNRG